MNFERDGLTSTTYDLAFVGAGLSSAATLLSLLDQLAESAPPEPVEILVVEKDDQFYTGIAYGQRSSNASLIITPLRDFLGESELAPFRSWMAANLDDLMDAMSDEQGRLTSEWLDRAKGPVANETCNDQHVPRFFFGRYFAQRVEAATQAAEALGIRVTRRVGEAATITEDGDDYRILGLDGSELGRSKRIILGLGMPPTRSLFGQLETIDGLIDDPYQPSMAATRHRISSTVEAKKAGDVVDILLVGANASGLEMLYQLTNEPDLEQFDTRFTVLSPQGRLPDRYTHRESSEFVASHLVALASYEAATAAAVLAAAKSDIAVAKAQSLELSDYFPAISSGVGALIGLLNDAEMQSFVNFEGVEIGRIQRRAGHEYSDVAQRLIAESRLTIVSGYYDSVSPCDSGGFDVNVQTADQATTYCLDTSFDFVMNCSGSAGLARPNPSALLESLLASGLCRPTESGNGIRLDDTMAAAPNLYVIGPLMAGNVVAGTPIWHVEHAGRILTFGTRLAAQLAVDLVSPAYASLP